MWNATKNGRAQEDAANDLGDDSGLSDLGKGVVEESAEDDNDSSLESVDQCSTSIGLDRSGVLPG